MQHGGESHSDGFMTAGPAFNRPEFRGTSVCTHTVRGDPLTKNKDIPPKILLPHPDSRVIGRRAEFRMMQPISFPLGRGRESSLQGKGSGASSPNQCHSHNGNR
ncbi:MAG: hypothetical protein FD153_1071 [Rhodospirillaceae bacterium]|nr:MAG: hypothetical protein FD153_1071 [Rhodospirillaceae bacterium]